MTPYIVVMLLIPLVQYSAPVEAYMTRTDYDVSEGVKWKVAHGTASCRSLFSNSDFAANILIVK